ncbi:MAG: porin [Planctomycetota bacterium]|nr:porin [Planctomycetota bacterium]
MKTKVLVVLAGAVLGMGSTALAQTNLDRERAYAAELNADAAARSSNLYGTGFKLSEGDATLNISGYTQIRYNANFRDDKSVGDQDDFTHGFNIPFTKLKFQGSVIEPGLTYEIVGAFQGLGDSSTDSGDFNLENAFGQYRWDSGVYVRFGQFKLPILREELIDNSRQLFVDRSVTNSVFQQDWSQGIELGYEGEQFRILGDFSDGWRTANTDFNSGAEADWALTGRVEFQALSTDWNRWTDFTSFRNSDAGLLIGAAAHYQQSGETGDGIDNANPSDVDLLLYTVDAAYEANGWNLYGAFIGANLDDDQFNDSADHFGIVFQGGLFVTDQVEIIARWDTTFVDDKAASANFREDTISFLTGGVNYYLAANSHAAKFTAQLIWAISETADLRTTSPVYGVGGGSSGGSLPNTQTTILGDREEGELALALQFQLGF